jgi:hypothetical protein
MASPVSEINLASLPELVSLTRQKFVEGPMLVEDYMAVRGLYISDDMPKNAGNTKKYNEIDGETYASNKAEGEDNSKARVIMGYNVTMTKKRVSKEIDITYEARNENRYPEVVGSLTDLSTFTRQRMTLDLTHRLTFCTATSYTDMDGDTVSTVVGDGLQLVYSTHTLSSAATTFSNVITGNPLFSPGAFQVARKLTTNQIFSHFGERRVMKFDTVVTTDDPATIDEVRKLMRSTSDPTQNNPGVVNVQANMFKHVILPRLATTATGAADSTKDKYWGYIATTGAPQNRWQAYFGMWEQPNMATPAPGNNGEDFHNQNWSFATYAGYGIAVVSPRGILWSTGAGA